MFEKGLDFAAQGLSSRRQAQSTARLMGCVGAHRVGDKWFPCASPEQLEALLTGGVVAYRAVRTKGLLGRSLGEMRSAVRGGGEGRSSRKGPRGHGKKKRRVSFDPKARDRDGDGLLQEGTTAERSADAVAEKPRGERPKARTINAPKKAKRLDKTKSKKRTVVKPKKKGNQPLM